MRLQHKELFGMRIVNKIRTKNILVIGDVMLDAYYIGDVKRISPEAPVPVFRKKKECYVLGGAANVAANLVAAHQNVSAMTIIGNDENGHVLESELNKRGIHAELMLKIDRSTTIKTRFITSNNQQVLRLDVEDTKDISLEEHIDLLNMFKKKIMGFDVILLSDYCKGLLTYDFTQAVIEMAKENHIPVVIDVKDKNIEKYAGAYLLKPNLRELALLTGMPVNTESEILGAAEYLRQRCKCGYVLVTRGADGMVLVGENHMKKVTSYAQEVYDVTGAGDTTIAYLAACIANGIPIDDGIEIANYAAGLQVAKVGTSVVSLEEVMDVFTGNKWDYENKILSSNDIERLWTINKCKKIVFTNGCFDILHTGHVRYLQEASKLGDILVIGLNSDASVKRLKGKDRPINSEKDRAELLCALEFVDYVAVFDEDTPYELIKKIQPDILVKGGDYQNECVVGTDIVEAKGGKVVLLPFVEGKSTTGIIEKIKH